MYSIVRNKCRALRSLILDFFPLKALRLLNFGIFYRGLQKFSSLMGFLLHKFAHFVHALRLFKALRLFFLTNFPGPTVIPCPTSIPDSRVVPAMFFEILILNASKR